MAYFIHGRALVPTPAGCVHGFKHGAQKGLVYAYIPIAAEKLGRQLLPEEVVHHIDLDPNNNDPDNLMVFASRIDHLLFHSYNCNMDLLQVNASGAYFLPEANKPKRACATCGKPTGSRHRKYCTRCLEQAAEERKASPLINGHPVTRELLQQQVWQKPMTKLAKDYGVSDKALDKWCKKLQIEKPPQGYWSSSKHRL